MADAPETAEDIDWNAIWVALQELGAALAPLEGRMPRGMRRLAASLDAAHEKAGRMALAMEDSDA